MSAPSVPIPVPGKGRSRPSSEPGSPGYVPIPPSQSLVNSFMTLLGGREIARSKRARSDDSSDEDEWDENNRLAHESLKLGNLSDALKRFTFCIEKRPISSTLLKRAAIYLRMERYAEALSDADRAVELSDGSAQAVYCQGLSLLGLEQYQQAINVFEKAASLVVGDEHVSRALAKTKILLAQTHGEYDWDKLLRTTLSKIPPACADYVGPVEIRMGENGRGLYLTRDVTAGELLIVSNPAVMVTATPKSPILPHISSHSSGSDEFPLPPKNPKVSIARSPSGRRAPSLATILAHKALNSPLLSARLWSLFDGSGYPELPVPHVSLFQAGVDVSQHSLPQTPPDAARIKRILRYSSSGQFLFGDGDGIRLYTLLHTHLHTYLHTLLHTYLHTLLHTHQASKKGLYLLPSFINHSCVGNVSELVLGTAVSTLISTLISTLYSIGSVLVIRAAIDLQAGSELVVPYFTPDVPLDIRQQRLGVEIGVEMSVEIGVVLRMLISPLPSLLTAEWDITCNCSRCCLERDFAPQLSEIMLPPETMEISNLPSILEAVEQLEDILEAASLDSRQESWVRHSYSRYGDECGDECGVERGEVKTHLYMSLLCCMAIRLSLEDRLYMAVELELESAAETSVEDALYRESLVARIVDSYVECEPSSSTTVRMMSLFGTKAAVVFPNHSHEWREKADACIKVYFGVEDKELIEILREALVLGALQGCALVSGAVEVV